MTALFSEQFIQGIFQLKIRARMVPPQGSPGEHNSKERGSGLEFCDFRSYAPGDDFRRIDWNVYQRTGKPFIRLYEEQERLPVYILLDSSDSMYFETPARADNARRMAALMACAALNQTDEIGIWPMGAAPPPPLGISSGKQTFPRVLDYLERIKPCGRTDLKLGVKGFAQRRRRSGLVVVISDFFDPQGLDHIIEGLNLLNHCLLLVQMVRQKDLAPDLSGQVRLCDCELDQGIDVNVTDSLRKRYLEAYKGFQDGLLAYATKRRAPMVRLDADIPVLEQVGGLFINNVFVF